MIPSFVPRALLLAVLAIGAAAGPVSTASSETAATSPVSSPCDTVRCAGGFRCEVVLGRAKCVPAEEKCGKTVCAEGLTCCNASCGICTKPGMMCTQQACVEEPPVLEPEPEPKPGVQCGPSTCADGEECCNESCGICAKPGGGCTKQFCPPTGPKCGPNQCYAGWECCNESCGICTPKGGFCTQQFCG